MSDACEEALIKILKALIREGDIAVDDEMRKAIEAAGFRIGDAADFLGMTDEERALLDARFPAVLSRHRKRRAFRRHACGVGIIVAGAASFLAGLYGVPSLVLPLMIAVYLMLHLA